jgi:apolipoprotein N-acyltransferase
LPATLFGRRAAYGLAVASGLLYVLGLPGVNVWPAAFVAYVPLLLSLRGRSPRDAAKLGLASGFVASVGGFYWLYGMMKLFSGMPGPVCAALMLATCAYQGGRTAVVAWLTARAAARGWPAAIAFVLGSITAELVYPLLFPWYFAFMMHRTPILMQAADLGGVYLVGALLLGPNLAFAEILRARRERALAVTTGGTPVPLGRVLVALGLAAPALAMTYGALRMRQVEAIAAAGQEISVGIAQGNLPLFDRKDGARIHSRLTGDLVAKGADLVVWSEGALGTPLEEHKLSNPKYGRVTEDLNVPVIFGANTLRKVGRHTRELNSAYLADFDGKIVGRYDKHYLLPFGEFLPFGETFPSLHRWSPNSGHMIAGESVAPLVIDRHPITVLICYEDILPWFVNRAVNEGRPELLVNITIDTWFGDTIEPVEHLALAGLRAVEHRRYLVRATNSGLSAIVDPVGRVTLQGGLFDEEELLGRVRLMSPRTLYEIVGDVPWYAAAIAAVLMAFLDRRRREDGAPGTAG